uniref:Uncharacterized protein n=1 Tax=Setaria digitata TaxID=48799 RepID=A0A915Q283_9BILA
MDKNSYAELMYIWGIDRMDAKRGFRWRVIFSRNYRRGSVTFQDLSLAIYRVPQDKCTDEMKYTAELAERMANFVLEDDCNEQ